MKLVSIISCDRFAPIQSSNFNFIAVSLPSSYNYSSTYLCSQFASPLPTVQIDIGGHVLQLGSGVSYTNTHMSIISHNRFNWRAPEC